MQLMNYLQLVLKLFFGIEIFMQVFFSNISENILCLIFEPYHAKKKIIHLKPVISLSLLTNLCITTV